MNRPILEKDIKKDVQRELIKLGIYSASEMGKHKTQPNGWYYMPVQSGMGTSKIADFIGHYKGFFWAIETKAPGKKCTGLQEWIGQRIIESGAVWFVVDGEESFQKFKAWVNNTATPRSCHCLTGEIGASRRQLGQLVMSYNLNRRKGKESKMKFEVDTTGSFYDEEQANKLKALGFKFGVNSYDTEKRPYKLGGKVEIEFNTLEELIAFSNTWGEIIISEGKVEIYDGYRE